MFGKRGGDDGDDTVYLNHLKQAHEADLSYVENTGCVIKGSCESGQPILAFFPSIGFGYRDKSEELLRQMLLLFIKTADSVVSQPYFIVYAHASVSWASQQPVIYDYYKILPRKYKKNLQRIFVMHPNSGVKMFFELTKMFLSSKFYDKLQFIETVAEFQTIVPPTYLQLPYSFVQSEDDSRGLKPSGVVVPLLVDFDRQVGTTTIMYRCVKYIRDNGGLLRQGLFRIPGNETLLSLIRTRLQPPINLEPKLMRYYMKCVCIGPDERIGMRGASSSSSSSSGVRASKSAASVDGVESLSILLKKDGTGLATKGADNGNVIDVPLESISYLVVTDIDTIAQVIKMSLRDLPVPLITFQAYDQMMPITKQYESKLMSKEVWCQQAIDILRNMPIEHSSTLAFLLDFLREVASHSSENLMDLQNLAMVFAPTVLRPLTVDTADPMKAFADVQLCKTILVNLLTQPVAERVLGFTTLSSHSEHHYAEIKHSEIKHTESKHAYAPPRRNHHSSTASSSAGVDVGDIQLDEKMLSRMAHLSLSSLGSTGRPTYNSVGRPAMIALGAGDVDHEQSVSETERERINSKECGSEGVLDEIAQKFDEEMEAANREHEQMLADKDSKHKKRKSKKRNSAVRRSLNNS